MWLQCLFFVWTPTSVLVYHNYMIRLFLLLLLPFNWKSKWKPRVYVKTHILQSCYQLTCWRADREQAQWCSCCWGSVWGGQGVGGCQASEVILYSLLCSFFYLHWLMASALHVCNKCYSVRDFRCYLVYSALTLLFNKTLFTKLMLFLC